MRTPNAVSYVPQFVELPVPLGRLALGGGSDEGPPPERSGPAVVIRFPVERRQVRGRA